MQKVKEKTSQIEALAPQERRGQEARRVGEQTRTCVLHETLQDVEHQRGHKHALLCFSSKAHPLTSTSSTSTPCSTAAA